MRVNLVNFVFTAFLLICLYPVNEVDGQMSWTSASYATGNQGWAENWGSNSWLGNSAVRRNWNLGVSGSNTDAGVIVQQVEPNSVAARAGIVPGDTIVCVAGDQVGRVGNQIFDLGEKLNHHADSRGQVLALVHFRRQGRLQPLQIQLQEYTAGLSGSLAFRGGRLPANSVVTVRLENVSRPYYRIRNGEYSFRVDGFGVGDIPFILNYDPNYIFNNDTYRLRAFVSAGGRTIFDTPRPPLVLTQGNPSAVRLVLRPSSNSSGGTGQIVNVGYAPADVYQQQVLAAYQRYLRRQPTSMEWAAWHYTPDLDYRVTRLGRDLMATQEFFNRLGGNNRIWVQQVFNEIIGHPPSATEMDLWMGRFAQLRYSRTELLDQLYVQATR